MGTNRTDSFTVWLFTRPGFEAEGGQEWLDRSREAGAPGFFTADAGTGLAAFQASRGNSGPAALRQQLTVDSMVFVRDSVFELQRINPLPQKDRVGALVDALGEAPVEPRWGEVMVHIPEGCQDKDLAAFARKWTAPVARALREREWLAPRRRSDDRRLDLILLDFERLIIGQSYPQHRATVPGGRPRLRFPPQAPSRSMLKLEEAFTTLLSETERRQLLKDGMRAVDLGASPGGWTFCLVGRGLRVTAVDNGPMDEALMRSGQVTHLKTDGFTWLPDRPVDWMVCDIVDQPRRTIDLVGRWFRGGHCRASVFNLKLPMKKRLEEWRLCRERLETALAATGRDFEIRAKQLYHDREEVTVLVLPGDAAA